MNTSGTEVARLPVFGKFLGKLLEAPGPMLPASRLLDYKADIRERERDYNNILTIQFNKN